MPGKLEVSFNSPQCGWMSIGFKDGETEFHTTTAHAPYPGALADMMIALADITDSDSPQNEHLLKWNRDPEAYDIRFLRNGEKLILEIYEYPTDQRDPAEQRLVFSHVGTVGMVCNAFAETFEQLYEDRDTDEFEFNWRRPFPFTEYDRFKESLERNNSKIHL
ncbi:MAG: hypothetical protein JO053_11575 [Acidobacteria bacterium]|nr:hypothetical protein [Acidobacteriota bacterium]